MTRKFDVIVIGGGPGGAAVATLIAQAGHEVALFERSAFPRFQVGESLVPAVNLTLEKLGVLEAMDARGFPRKNGVQFFSPSGPTRPFYFSEVSDPKLHHTWQVLRSDFDALLLENATRAGVEARTETEVLDIRVVDGVVSGIRIKNSDGTEQEFDATVVVDATGQQGMLTRRFGGRTHLPGLENASVYAHYRDAVRDEGVDAGSTLIFRLEGNAWVWFIPLPDTVSIGLVAPARSIASFGGTPAEILDTAIAASEPLRARLAHAERTTEPRAVRDYSYVTTRDGGPGWMLVGDALAFIDPIYSTGLFLTMLSAELGANAIHAALERQNGQPDFTGYSKEYQAAFDQFLPLVQAFYREDFHFGQLAKNPEHRQGLIDLLTGIVGTPQAIEVTRAIRAFFAEHAE